MKILFRLAYTCLFLITIFSCVNDENSIQQTITFTVHSTYEKYWIALSDHSGKVLSWKEMTNGVMETFTYPETESATLSLIVKTLDDNPSTKIKTYTNVAAGNYIMGTSVIDTPSEPTATSTFTLNVIHPELYNNIYTQSEGFCGYIPGGDQSQIDFGVCDPNSGLFISLQKANERVPRYVYRDNIKGSLTLDDPFFNLLPVMKSKTLKYATPITGYSLVVGNTIKNKNAFTVSMYFSDNNDSELKIYYPDLSGILFDSYKVSLYFSEAKYIHYYIDKESAEPANSYAPLDVSFNFADTSKITTQAISFQTSGQADYITSTFSDDNSEYFWWYVYTPFANDITLQLPVFPDDLRSSANLSFVDRLTRNGVTFVENKELDGYKGFYRSELMRQSIKYSDRRSKAYQFSPKNVVVGRVASPKKP